jgi:CarD family transcriptional regulator
MEQSKKLLFYPMYGVCILESVEKEDDLENLQSSYNLYFPKQGLRMLIPQQRALQKCIRPLSNVDYFLSSRAQFYGEYAQLPLNPSERRCFLQAKIESGLLQDHFGIIRDIICSKAYNLKMNSHDRSILSMAREMLVSELMYVLNLSADDAGRYLKEDIEKRQLG